MTPTYSFSVYAVPPAVTALALLLVGVAVLIRERASRVSVAFLFILLATSVWLFGLTAMYCATNEAVAIWWARFHFLGIPFIPSTIYLFSVVAMGIYARRKRLIWAGLLLSAFFSAAALYSDVLVAGVYRYWWGYYPRYGWLGILFLAFFFGLALANRRDCWVEYRKAEPGTHKLRLRALFIAFGIAYLGGLDYLPCYGVPLYAFGYLPVFVCLALTARVTQRYRLVDIAPALAANEIIATMADPLAVCDVDGRIRVVNQALCATLGYTQQELLGERIECLAGADSGGVEHLRQLLSPGTARNEEMLFQTKGGEPVAVSISLSPLQDRDRNRVGAILIAHDIRERKRAEAALRASEKKFQGLFESSRDAIMTLEPPSWRFTSGNPATIKMFGAKNEEEFISRGPWELSPDRQPDGRASAEKANEMIETAMREGSHFFEWTHRRIGGEEFSADVLLTRMEQGGKAMLQATVRDITERKRAEANQQLVVEVLHLLNRSGDLTALVEEVVQLIKRSTDFEAVGVRLRAGEDFPYFVATGFPEDFVCAERYLCARDQAGELVRDSKGNPVLECMCGNILCGRTNPALPFFTEGGSFWTNSTTHLLGTATEADRLARTRNRCNGEGYESVALMPLRSGDQIIGLLQLNDRRRGRFTPEFVRFLEGLAESIGVALKRGQAEVEAMRLIDELERANRLKSDFMSTMSHELRTPLTIIMGYHDLLLGEAFGPMGPDQVDTLRRTQKSTGELLALITATLDIGRLETGKGLLDVQEIDLGELSREIAGETTGLPQTPTVPVVWDVPAELPRPHTDRAKLKVVVKNLLANAVKFTEHGQVTVRARACDGGVEIAVADTGIGIGPDVLPIIFEPFRQAESGATSRRGGVGLGLYIVRRYLDLLGGTIRVESELGRGSTFRVWLPAGAPAGIP